MDLYNFKKTETGFEQTSEYIAIGFLSEFTSKWNVEQFINRNNSHNLEVSQFDFLLKADDSHIREIPIEYPFFRPSELFDIVDVIRILTKEFIADEKFEKLNAFLKKSVDQNYYVQALIA